MVKPDYAFLADWTPIFQETMDGQDIKILKIWEKRLLSSFFSLRHDESCCKTLICHSSPAFHQGKLQLESI